MFAIVDKNGKLLATWGILGTQPEIYTQKDDAELVARTAYHDKGAKVVSVRIITE